MSSRVYDAKNQVFPEEKFSPPLMSDSFLSNDVQLPWGTEECQ